MAKRKTNPRTLVTTIQKAFEADLYHRLWRDASGDRNVEPLRAGIIERVVDDDMLGLETLSVRRDPETASLQFDFPENPEKAAEFEDWLNGAISNDVLESASRRQVADGRHYSSEYVRRSGEQGVKHAHRELRRAGVDIDEPDSLHGVLQTPVHQDILQSAYLRTYDELDGVTTEMARDISRVMSDSLADGVNPRETARRMTDRVDKIGLTRGRRIARSETSRVYSNQAVARYGELGVQEVKILTANPCERCGDLADQGPYPVGDAMNLIPNETHPNCVCSPAPVTQTMEYG